MLALKNVSTVLGHANIDLTVRQGEIVGLYGLVGAGRTELAKCILGVYPPTEGQIEIAGRPERIASVADAIPRCGIGYISEDRKQEGLILAHTVLENAGMTVWRKLAGRFGLLRDENGARACLAGHRPTGSAYAFARAARR